MQQPSSIGGMDIANPYEQKCEIDTLAGIDTQIPDDFLEYLLKNMLSGTGVPSSFVNQGLEDIEFAKTIAMQNG